MKSSFKTALAALVLTAGATAAIPASAQSFGVQFGPGGIGFSYDSGGYCDSYGCPDDFWDLPVYYGAVFWDGQWYDGPVYYRSFFGHRQYWIAGGWRDDEWRGPHPGWWREGRYGQALGMEYYRDHGFHGRWDRDQGRGYDRRGYDQGGNGSGRGGRDFNQRNLNQQGGGNFDRRDFNQPGGRGSLDQRGDHGGADQRGNRGGDWGRGGQRAQPQAQQPPQQQPPAGFQPRGGGHGRYDRSNAAAPQPAPAPAAPPAAPQADSGGDHHHRDRH